MRFHITGKKPKGVNVVIENLFFHTGKEPAAVYGSAWDESSGNGNNENEEVFKATFEDVVVFNVCTNQTCLPKWLKENAIGIEVCLDLSCSDDAVISDIIIETDDQEGRWKFGVPVYMEDCGPKRLTLEEGDSISAEKDNIKVEIENIGEGICGDYDPNDPEDDNYLRFTVYRKDYKGHFEQVDDASYCTQIPADTPKLLLDRALSYLLKEFHSVLSCDPFQSVKKLGEHFSWISPYELVYRDDEIIRVIDEINDRNMEFGEKEHDQLDAIRYSIAYRKEHAS